MGCACDGMGAYSAALGWPIRTRNDLVSLDRVRLRAGNAGARFPKSYGGQAAMSDLWYPPEMRGLISAARECADALESEVEHYYALTKDYPSEKRRYERDMAPVTKLREEIEILRLKKATAL